MKKVFSTLAALSLLAVMLYAAEKVLLKLAPLETSSDYGVICPNADNTVDLGTDELQFRNLHIDGTAYLDAISGCASASITALTVSGAATVGTTLEVTAASTLTGDVSGGADVRCTSFLGVGTSYTVNVVTATAIAATASNLQLLNAGQEDGVITMTATPVFSTTTASAGDYMVVTTTQSGTFVLDEGANEALQLGGSTRTIGQYDSLFLIFKSSGTGDYSSYWQEISFVDN